MSDSHYIDVQNVKALLLHRGDWWLADDTLFVIMSDVYARSSLPPYINIVKPVNGRLVLTGQVLAGYIVNKAPV